MPKDVEPFQPAQGSPPLPVALGCKGKAHGAKPYAFNSGEKPCLVTLRDHSPVSFFGRKAGLAHGKALLRNTPVRRLPSSESDAAYTTPSLTLPRPSPGHSGVVPMYTACAAHSAPYAFAALPRVARDVFVTRSRQP